MSPARRAGAPRLIDWTGERCVPWAPDVQVVYEHLHRYLWAARLVGGRRVLDLGSGEGFGAAILADSAAEVLGVDIDELTVEHSTLNYASSNLSFQVGTALDLSAHEAGSFGAVVAFEVIEHLGDQQRALSEIERLLGADGILLMSTPDRCAYRAAASQSNPFHEHELAQEEFLKLLSDRFPHVAVWAQRPITGSHLRTLQGAPASPLDGGSPDFYLERAGDEWRVASDPAALYLVAVASRVELPASAASSTLIDCGLELVRAKERDTAVVTGARDAALHRILELERALRDEQAEHASMAGELERTLAQERAEHARTVGEFERTLREERAEQEAERAEHARALRGHAATMSEEIEVRERDILRGQEDLSDAREEIKERDDLLSSMSAELAQARQLNRRTEESVMWQAFQRTRGRLYAAIGGERSLLARALGLSLRLAGGRLTRREVVQGPPASATLAEPRIEVISLPVVEEPKVSLVIPLYSGAELTRACLKSIRENTTGVSYEVILVDDAADAETKLLLEGVRGATILRNETNLGYLRSVNRGASAARGRWLVLFNNDTEVTRGWLIAMLDCAQSAPDVGVVTPKYLYPDGTINEAGAIIWRDGTGANYGRGDAPDLFQYEYRRETDYGSAAALMVSAPLWAEIGGFDERFLPMYYEDADLCFQARERGMRVLYEPSAVVVHREGGTVGTDLGSGLKRHQEANRPRFVAKWRHRLDADHLRSDPANLRVAASRRRGPHVLVVDHCVPEWDRDAGSLRMLSIMRALQDLGARVTFMPDSLSPTWPYTRLLQQMGIEVLYGALDVRAEFATIGSGLNMAILSRPHSTARWLDLVRQFAPAATVVYDTVDLHWLRETRKSAVEASANGTLGSGNGVADLGAMSPQAKALRHLELAMIRAADATIVVSDSERRQVELDVPDARVVMLPTVHAVEPYVVPPEDRSGILFIGGFRHPPNAGAAIRLVKEVMPEVWRELGDVRVTVVGSDAPPEVGELASPLVDVAGWVEDLRPLLEQARVLVAPLRYGAGLNGKITQALAAGLPVVTTPVGADGLDGLDQCLLVAQESAMLAEHTIRLYTDSQRWRELSRAGRELIARHCSPEVISEQLSMLLKGVMPPLSHAGGPHSEWRSGSGGGSPSTVSGDVAGKPARKADQVVVVGNCQATALETMMSTNEAFRRRFQLVTFPAVHEIPDAMVPALHDAVAGCSVLVVQRVDESYRGGLGLGTDTLASIASSATVVRWPSVYWAGYFPDLFYLRDADGQPVVSGPFDYHDRVILEAYAAGTDVRGACRLLEDAERPSDAEAWADTATAELEVRGRYCDIQIAEFIASEFREQLLFFTMNHPANRLLAFIAARIMDMIGVPGGIDLGRVAGEVLGLTFYPLHANHVRALGLAFGAQHVFGSTPFKIRGAVYEPAAAVQAFFAYYAEHPQLMELNLGQPAS
jgi:GT2 family glycosyltransferase/glycosyltransferase involved in cell wall biosynthesis/SAM-dependent methyltransferase